MKQVILPALAASSLVTFSLAVIGCSSSEDGNGGGDGDGVQAGSGSSTGFSSGGASSGGANSGGSSSGGSNSGGQSSSGGSGDGGSSAVGGGSSGGSEGTGGTDNPPGSGGSDGAGGSEGSGGSGNTECTDSGAAENMSFFVTSWHHIEELSGSSDGFGGDLRYNGAATGLEGADAICQEIASRVCHGHKTWKAYLSTSTQDAIDRVGEGPWYDYAGNLFAEDKQGLTSVRPGGGCCAEGLYDELGTFHDGSTDVNNDGQDDDDHDVITGTLQDGTYAGFSCEDWTSTTASGGGGRGGGLQLGHMWPARSGESWVESHGAGCGAGTNFIQSGGGDGITVGSGGGYGGFYCFALAE